MIETFIGIKNRPFETLQMRIILFHLNFMIIRSDRPNL